MVLCCAVAACVGEVGWTTLLPTALLVGAYCRWAPMPCRTVPPARATTKCALSWGEAARRLGKQQQQHVA